jgi:hypothetical protein
MDAKDPTPWFYDAIRKQTTNRPVEALHDMQKAIELNDNRGVYRSKLLLDEDLAARSASLGRIYNDLGFQQLGLVEGWKSVNSDPSNYSAHRLLADNYASRPRHEIARVSELLQSQLLQPININPIQPRLAESDRLASNVLGNPSFNEYNSMFARNQFTIQGSGVIGNNDSIGDELVLAGIWNKFSYSLGQYHFETDGIRENNDIKQDIYNAFGQYQISNDLNLQFEYRYNFLNNGDLSQRFNSSIFSTSLNDKFKRQLYRVGANYNPNPSTNILLSAIYINDDFLTNQEAQDSLSKTETIDKTDTSSVELQLIKKINWAKFVIGGSYVNTNRTSNTEFTGSQVEPATVNPFTGQILIPSFKNTVISNQRIDFDSTYISAYLYSYLTYRDFTSILGVSYNSLNNDTFSDLKRFNPKLGISWKISDSTTFRASYIESIKKPFAANQTIEPTQVAGFNQLFDDTDSTESRLFGIGLDHKFNSSIYAGLEGSYRKLKIPLIKPNPPEIRPIGTLAVGKDNLLVGSEDTSQLNIERLNEFNIRSYINFTITNNLAFSTEYQFEKVTRKFVKNFSDESIPISVITHQIPFTLSYFSPNGFYSTFSTTLVKQEVESQEKSDIKREHFWIFDALLGYRLPKRYGRIVFGVKNLTDKEIQFSEQSLVTGLPNIPRFRPERTFFGQIIIDFNL